MKEPQTVVSGREDSLSGFGRLTRWVHMREYLPPTCRLYLPVPPVGKVLR